MSDDRSEMKVARDAGLVKRHEQRLARAKETPTHTVDGVRLAAWEREMFADKEGMRWRLEQALIGVIPDTNEGINVRLAAADAVLALLPAEAETKALVETATRLGRELGRREAAEEAAEAMYTTPSVTFDRDGVALLPREIAARIAREIATKEPK